MVIAATHAVVNVAQSYTGPAEPAIAFRYYKILTFLFSPVYLLSRRFILFLLPTQEANAYRSHLTIIAGRWVFDVGSSARRVGFGFGGDIGD